MLYSCFVVPSWSLWLSSWPSPSLPPDFSSSSSSVLQPPELDDDALLSSVHSSPSVALKTTPRGGARCGPERQHKRTHGRRR